MRQDTKENTGPKRTVLFENVGSMEYYAKDGVRTQVLHNINFEAKAGEIWCVTGELAFEMRLLLEIAANARPYETGRCVLNETGMMRKKRVILPHVFYIGGTNIMFGNMNVLEYLMLITQKQEEHPVRRQRRIFDQLNELGLAYLSLTPIQTLTPAERSIVLLLAGSYTQSVILVWNLPRLDYTTELAGAAEKICEVLKEQGKTLLFSTKDYGLADRISTHILLLKRGTAAYAGKAEEFRTKWDRLILTIRGCDTKHFEEIFRQAAPEYEYRIGDGAVEVLDRSSCETDFTTFYRITADNRLMPDLIERNRPNIGNAVEAAIRSDDI